MNNAQFRKLLETPRPPPSSTSPNGAPSATPVLGSRARPSIPMTPRSVVTSTDFAKQLAAHRAEQAGDKPTKKFRSSAAPKGTKFGAGYTDRAKAREAESEVDEREERLNALKELLKEGKIELEEYERQTKLMGGDVSSTHLVRGLDFALLKRVKAGEDVLNIGAGAKKEEEDEELEDKLDEVLEKEVAPVERPKEKKKGELAAPKKSRAEILAELKREREEKKKAMMPSLGKGFRKIGEKREEEKKEEEEVKVKHVVGADGKIKRKIKRSDKERERRAAQEAELAAEKAPMGMMPPPPLPNSKPAPPDPEEDDDEDIFAGVGDYDPLAGIADDDDDSSEDESAPKRPKPDTATEPSEPKPPTDSMPPPPRPKIKYFDEPDTPVDDDTYKPPESAESLLKANPDLAAALARASKIGAKQESEQEKKRKALMAAQERDAYDIDMGFGGSTNFDDDDDDEVPSGAGGKKRKRGKKKGDKNSADVVAKVVKEKYGE